jgi:hypothetical protein
MERWHGAQGPRLGIEEVNERNGDFSPTEPISCHKLKSKKPTLKQVQAVRCPTCGAGPGEKCELSTGQPRTEPHRDRRLIAAD